MVQDGSLELAMLAVPYTRVAGTGAGGGRDEELAARWADIPNEVVAVSLLSPCGLDVDTDAGESLLLR